MLCGTAEAATSLTSGGCSEFRKYSPVRRYATPAVMCQGSSIVNPSRRVAQAERKKPATIRETASTKNRRQSSTRYIGGIVHRCVPKRDQPESIYSHE